MTINLTPIFIVAGTALIVTILEKVLSKSGGESFSQLLSVMGMGVCWMAIYFFYKDFINEIIATFFNM